MKISETLQFAFLSVGAEHFEQFQETPDGTNKTAALKMQRNWKTAMENIELQHQIYCDTNKTARPVIEGNKIWFYILNDAVLYVPLMDFYNWFQ